MPLIPEVPDSLVFQMQPDDVSLLISVFASLDDQLLRFADTHRTNLRENTRSWINNQHTELMSQLAKLCELLLSPLFGAFRLGLFGLYLLVPGDNRFSLFGGDVVLGEVVETKLKIIFLVAWTVFLLSLDAPNVLGN